MTMTAATATIQPLQTIPAVEGPKHHIESGVVSAALHCAGQENRNRRGASSVYVGTMAVERLQGLRATVLSTHFCMRTTLTQYTSTQHMPCTGCGPPEGLQTSPTAAPVRGGSARHISKPELCASQG